MMQGSKAAVDSATRHGTASHETETVDDVGSECAGGNAAVVLLVVVSLLLFLLQVAVESRAAKSARSSASTIEVGLALGRASPSSAARLQSSQLEPQSSLSSNGAATVVALAAGCSEDTTGRSTGAVIVTVRVFSGTCERTTRQLHASTHTHARRMNGRVSSRARSASIVRTSLGTRGTQRCLAAARRSGWAQLASRLAIRDSMGRDNSSTVAWRSRPTFQAAIPALHRGQERDRE